jgi:hypothetical protein
MKTKNKSILQTLREIRDEQSEKYFNNPELLKKDLEKIRKKYHLKPKNETESAIV